MIPPFKEIPAFFTSNELHVDIKHPQILICRAHFDKTVAKDDNFIIASIGTSMSEKWGYIFRAFLRGGNIFDQDKPSWIYMCWKLEYEAPKFVLTQIEEE